MTPADDGGARGEIRHLRAADARRIPWKNGRGVTEELALWPPGASLERDDFDWRISRAAVDADGPFSAFPGRERVLVITSGAGLVLDHGGCAPRARVSALQPCRFSGDWPTTASLLDGPVTDFNVLVRPSACAADVVVLRPGPRRTNEVLHAEHTLLHVLAGGLHVRVRAGAAATADTARPVTLAERETFWIVGARPREILEITGERDGALALLLRLAPGRGVR